MLGEPILGKEAGELGIATHVVPTGKLAAEAETLAQRLASGPTRSYAATRTILKAWSGGGITAADAVMPDVTMELFFTQDVQRGFINTAKAFDADIEPPEMTFEGK
jgi:enoyl-CoA hydratase/carnithine racemase